MYGARVSTDGALSSTEKWLVGVLWCHAALSVLWVALAWRDGIVEDADLRFVVNTTAKDGLFAVLSVVVALDVRRRLRLLLLLLAAYGFLIVGELVELAFADPADVRTLPSDTGATAYLLLWTAGDVVIVVVLALLYRAASRRR